MLNVNFSRRWLVVIGLLLVMMTVLSACVGTEDENAPTEVPRSSNDERADLDGNLSAWESSLRAEFDWLWPLATDGSARPIPEYCDSPGFSHKPVTLSDDKRVEDDVAGWMVDNLAYADTLILQSREKWVEFCDVQASLSDSSGYIQVRLSSAYEALNNVRRTLDLREQSRDR